jgi:multidrug efflux pump subunit AcrB
LRYLAGQAAGAYPAVTLAIAKRKNTNAITVAERVLEKVTAVQAAALPSDVHLTVTRHYGHTAAEKSNELLLHMAIAVLSVSALIWLVLGRRESGVVLTAIPVTLALTLAVFYFYGYTLNRITLFALIFFIGILVDDAIVVVENIVRHARLPENHGRALAEVAAQAVDEVGNPTILATLTVIAAILPMAFVGGLMGPYMRPIPVGATAAMVFSLLVAFIVTPWAAVRMLKPGEHGSAEAEDRLTRLYRQVMSTLIHRVPARLGFLALVTALLIGAMALVAAGWVRVKMLPFDNKSEFQVVIDMPEGATLEETARVTAALADVVQRQPEVVNLQTYVGAAAPFNFNGLVRHYYLRRGPNVADIQVNLSGKSERKLQSHEIAKRVRRELAPLAERLGARMKVAEVPPGPPVLQTLVAEVYGPDDDGQVRLARAIREVLEKTPGIVDVDWYVEDPQPKYRLVMDREKAAQHGVSEAEVARTVRMLSAGERLDLLHRDEEKEDVPVVLRLDRATRSSLADLSYVKMGGASLGEFVRVEQTTQERSIYHKNLMPVVYVTADVAGEIESPVYAILAVRQAIAKLPPPGGARYEIVQHTASQPFLSETYSMKWDGEWHITYEVFRDLGLAFAAVLVLIYILVVGWFQSFLTPAVIMAAIPFSLVGILPGHAALGAFFTATSMIGFIAGAGIVVRNSIILVDFVELRRRQGLPLDEAVIEAGAVRFRPMLLTAMAVVAGSAVILFDPIFQGLAISLMAGEVASLLLSRMTVPILYYLAKRRTA